MFRCSVGNYKYEEIAAYYDLLKYIGKADNDPIVWKLKQILGHEGLSLHHTQIGRDQNALSK